MQKNFRLNHTQTQSLALGLGGCMASDRILVDGRPVGYMYRERPVDPHDSGWRFLAGDEDTAYMENNTNHGIYDMNTIVNYCPDILPFIDAEVGSAFERDEDDGGYILLER